jgi:hypothetical protein
MPAWYGLWLKGFKAGRSSGLWTPGREESALQWFHFMGPWHFNPALIILLARGEGCQSENQGSALSTQGGSYLPGEHHPDLTAFHPSDVSLPAWIGAGTHRYLSCGQHRYALVCSPLHFSIFYHGHHSVCFAFSYEFVYPTLLQHSWLLTWALRVWGFLHKNFTFFPLCW